MIVCATLKEAVAQRRWLGLQPTDSVLITNPRTIARLRGIPPEKIGVVYVSISVHPDLMAKIESYIHYLGLKVERIH